MIGPKEIMNFSIQFKLEDALLGMELLALTVPLLQEIVSLNAIKMNTEQHALNVCFLIVHHAGVLLTQNALSDILVFLSLMQDSLVPQYEETVIEISQMVKAETTEIQMIMMAAPQAEW
jgi:hypothetical protein